MSCVCQRLMEFLSGGSTSNCRRKLRWTVITDVVFAYSTAQNAFCCLVGAILNILCPRERRVFQSKLGVSSSNQCNLHHSPHTGHLEKSLKKRVQSFSDTVYIMLSNNFRTKWNASLKQERVTTSSSTHLCNTTFHATHTMTTAPSRRYPPQQTQSAECLRYKISNNKL